MELPQAPAPRCMYLNSKSLAVNGEDFADARERGGDVMTDCWCVKTGRALGPDDAPTGLKACSDPDRDCYREY